jgi:hypothetical protein
MTQKNKMKNSQIAILISLGVFACIVISGAGFFIFQEMTNQNLSLIFSNPENEIIGKWEIISENNAGEIYEFFADGSLSAGFFPSEYSFPDQTHIKIKTGNLIAILEYTLSNNELILINRDPIFSPAADDTPYILKLKKIE